MELSEVYDRKTAIAYVNEAEPLSKERELRKAAVFLFLYGGSTRHLGAEPDSQGAPR